MTLALCSVSHVNDLLMSQVVGFNHLLLGFADRGDVTLAVALAFVVGMPYGAR